MCGVSIIFHSDGRPVERGRIVAMNEALRHRGPDNDGVWMGGYVAFGHTRLSIVDITSGDQPMISGDGRYVIVYNGEIYNYRELRRMLEADGTTFRTQSDTEVVLALFIRESAACLNKLRGMFAFSIFDTHTGDLFVARDRLGIKPLFYHWDGETLVAASEMKALFASGLIDAQLDCASVKNYFAYQFSITPHTPFMAVKELPPGFFAVVTREGKVRLTQYWDLEFPVHGEYESLSEDYWLGRFEDHLNDAVNSHTIGEVSIGTYLSGGIDSCAVTTLLSQFYDKPLESFSIQFADADYDESPVYKRIARRLGVGNSELELARDGPPSPLATLQSCLYHLEQPQRMAVDLPHYMLSGLVRRQRYKVVYTGDGADEILAGYDCFRQDYMRVSSNGFLKPLWRSHRYMTEFTQYFSEDFMRMLLRLHTRASQAKTIKRFGFYPAWYDFWQITQALSQEVFDAQLRNDTAADEQMENMIGRIKPHVRKRHPLNQSLYMETKTRLPGWILWKSDRLSMANSVEARVPFMDHPLVELAARIPPQLKLNGMNEKYILKRMIVPRLPPTPHGFKKRAFYTPIKQWFFMPHHRDQLEPFLSDKALSETGMFDAKAVRRLYERLLAMPHPKDMNGWYRLTQLEWVVFTVLSVQLLHRQFVSGRGAGA